jgi:tetratricopeptide (TPR) repeat protein
LISIRKNKLTLSLVCLLGSLPIQALTLDEVWNLLQRSKEEYQLQDKSPVLSSFRFGYEGPQTYTKEALNHEVFNFCFKYIEKYHSSYKFPRLRQQIRQHLSDLYGEQIFQNLLGKSSISCYSNHSEENGSIKIEFYSDRKFFKPHKWDYIGKDGIIYLSDEDETKSGRIDSSTTYSAPNCKKEIRKDKNGYGGIDEWWFYDKCNLVKVEYDENENGFRERTCDYELGRLVACHGVGEREEKDARFALFLNDTETALRLFRQAHEEIKKEFTQPSFKSCILLKEIIALDFQKKDYSSFARSLDEFLNIPQCEKSSLAILIYKGYYLLYLSKNYKEAKLIYRKAAEDYFKENGEENPELILNLALAEYLDKDPLSCIASLERLRERRMLYAARFYFFYYRASCNLLLSKHDESIEDFKKALLKSTDSEYHPLIHFKMANAYYQLDRKSEGIPYLVQALHKDLNLIQWIINDPLYIDFLESQAGKSLISKYYLNHKQK